MLTDDIWRVLPRQQMCDLLVIVQHAETDGTGREEDGVGTGDHDCRARSAAPGAVAESTDAGNSPAAQRPAESGGADAPNGRRQTRSLGAVEQDFPQVSRQ